MRTILIALVALGWAFPTAAQIQAGAGGGNGFETAVLPSAAEFVKEPEKFGKERDAQRQKLQAVLDRLVAQSQREPNNASLPVQIPAYRALLHENERVYHERMERHWAELENRLEAALARLGTDLSEDQVDAVLASLRESRAAFGEMISKTEADLQSAKDFSERRDLMESLAIARAQALELDSAIEEQEALLHGRGDLVEKSNARIRAAQRLKEQHDAQRAAERGLRDQEAMKSLMKQYERMYEAGQLPEPQDETAAGPGLGKAKDK